MVFEPHFLYRQRLHRLHLHCATTSFCSNSWKLTRQHKTTLGSNHLAALAGRICCLRAIIFHGPFNTQKKSHDGKVGSSWSETWLLAELIWLPGQHERKRPRVPWFRRLGGLEELRKAWDQHPTSNSKVFLILLSTFFPWPVLETWHFPLRLAQCGCCARRSRNGRKIQPMHQGCHRSLASSWAPICKGPQTSPSPPMKSFLLFFGRGLRRKSRILVRGCAVDDQEGVHDVHDRCFWGHWGSSGSKST